MRCRITGKISRVHSISFMEAHEVAHRCGNEFAAVRHFHIDIGVGNNRSAIPIYDLPVNARMMIYLLLKDLERPGLSKMAVASARDW